MAVCLVIGDLFRGRKRRLRWCGLLGAGRECWGRQPPSSRFSPSIRPLRNPRLVARKTPHRFRPKTPESASPLGEGKERRILAGIDAAHPPVTTVPVAPLRTRVMQRSPQGEGARATASLGTRDRFARVSTRDRLTANEPGASTGRGRLATGFYEGSGGSSNWAAWRSR